MLAAYADRPTVSIERLTENTGGAGGFSRGMSLAYERGADFVWIMDDDCYADPTALGELLDGHAAAEKSMGMRLPFACSVVRWTDGDICEMNNPEPTWDWGKLLVRGESSVLVNSCSFVSVLFPRWVLAEFGLPLAEYFIWFDDQEYTRRITKAGPGVQVLRSTVTHDLGVNRGVNFGDVNAGNMWKFEYGVRNEASYRWHHEDPFAAMRFAQRLYRRAQGRPGVAAAAAAAGPQVPRGRPLRPQAELPAVRSLTGPARAPAERQGRRANRSRRPARVRPSQRAQAAQVAAAEEEDSRTGPARAGTASASPAGP